jgi:hypothetical protein
MNRIVVSPSFSGSRIDIQKLEDRILLQPPENADPFLPQLPGLFFVRVSHMDPDAAVSDIAHQVGQDAPSAFRRQRIQIDETGIEPAVRARIPDPQCDHLGATGFNRPPHPLFVDFIVS